MSGSIYICSAFAICISVGPGLTIKSIIVAVTNVAVTHFFKLMLKDPKHLEVMWHCCVEMTHYPPIESDLIKFIECVHMILGETDSTD